MPHSSFRFPRYVVVILLLLVAILSSCNAHCVDCNVAGATNDSTVNTTLSEPDARIEWREELRPTEPFSHVLLRFHSPPPGPAQFSCGGTKLAVLPAPEQSQMPSTEADEPAISPWHILELDVPQAAGVVCELTSRADFQLADARFTQSAGGLREVLWYDDYDTRHRFLPRFQTFEHEEGCDRGMCLGLRPSILRRGEHHGGEQRQELHSPADIMRFRSAPRSGAAEIRVELGGDGGELTLRFIAAGATASWSHPNHRNGESLALPLHPDAIDVASVSPNAWRSGQIQMVRAANGATEAILSVDGMPHFHAQWRAGSSPPATFGAVVFAAKGGALLDDFVAGISSERMPPPSEDQLGRQQHAHSEQQYQNEELPQQQQLQFQRHRADSNAHPHSDSHHHHDHGDHTEQQHEHAESQRDHGQWLHNYPQYRYRQTAAPWWYGNTYHWAQDDHDTYDVHRRYGGWPNYAHPWNSHGHYNAWRQRRARHSPFNHPRWGW